MWFAGQRKTLPASLYANELAILEDTGLDYWQIQELPADYVDELLIRLSKRRIAENRAKTTRPRKK